MKRSTKRFTGCWTCRRRGIKCDETRPGCLNCQTHGTECEGYRLKLCWDSGGSKKRTEKNRSLVLFEWKENELLDSLQVDYFLDRIDTASGFISSKTSDTKDEFQYGPFTVFKASNEPPVPLRSGFSLGDKDMIRKRLKQIAFVGLGNDLEVEVTLVDFYARYLSNILTPVDQSEINPYHTLLKDAMGKDYPMEVRGALIHSVCAIGSSFLATNADYLVINPAHKDTDFSQYWRFHKMRALSFVSASYSWKEASTKDELSILVGSIFFLLNTDIFNSSDEWQIHLRGAVATLKIIFKTDRDSMVHDLDDLESLSSAVVFFAQLTKLTYLFSTMYLYMDGVENKYLNVDDLDFIDLPETSLEQSLLYRSEGVTPAMVQCLTHIVKHFQTGDRNLEELEREVESCKPPEYTNTGVFNDLMRYHQSMIFYTALRLTWLREVKSLDPHKLQGVVESGLDHIQMSEEIGRGNDGIGIFWPGFVICSEATSADNQARATAWMKDIEPHCVTSMTRGSKVIKTVWERRKGGNAVSWIQVIQEIDPTLMLV